MPSNGNIDKSVPMDDVPKMTSERAADLSLSLHFPLLPLGCLAHRQPIHAEPGPPHLLTEQPLEGWHMRLMQDGEGEFSDLAERCEVRRECLPCTATRHINSLLPLPPTQVCCYLQRLYISTTIPFAWKGPAFATSQESPHREAWKLMGQLALHVWQRARRGP